MKKKTLLKRYLLSSPGIRGLFEWTVLIATGMSGCFFSIIELPYYRYFLISGIILLVSGSGIHGASHVVHSQAHDKTDAIKGVVTTGIYSKIRHPGYLGMILTYIGFAFICDSLLPITVALILSVLSALKASKEEEQLIKKFGEEYAEYMKRVPWRFIPKIF